MKPELSGSRNVALVKIAYSQFWLHLYRSEISLQHFDQKISFFMERVKHQILENFLRTKGKRKEFWSNEITFYIIYQLTLQDPIKHVNCSCPCPFLYLVLLYLKTHQVFWPSKHYRDKLPISQKIRFCTGFAKVCLCPMTTLIHIGTHTFDLQHIMRISDPSKGKWDFAKGSKQFVGILVFCWRNHACKAC